MAAILLSSTTLAIFFVGLTDNLMIAYAGIDPDDTFGSEKECAEKFDPEYDRENYQTCAGDIGTPGR
jgi:hypothetical protein